MKAKKEQISLKKEAEKAMRKAEVTVPFYEGIVIIGEESYTEWKGSWTKLKKDLHRRTKNKSATKFGRKGVSK